ncbi:WecB/TagA/CpsF family glycosyltransferase [Candidatus Daviesbacteria bacterium]|nr:WecB/TagA/CpsF family glycosyltransferase [Candidatus Daviesbacteria bacterium]
MKVKVLGVKIDDVSMDEGLAQVEKWIIAPGKYYIVTPNPEFIVSAQKDSHFKKILNDADLSIPDGAGLRLSGSVKNTISGTDFMEELIKLSAEKGFVIGFLGGKEGVAERTVERLKKKYPGLKVNFINSGGDVNKEGKTTANLTVPPLDILFVAFGHIKQEKWIADNLAKIPAHVSMGVGGAFDYLSGSIPRAPKWVRSLGLEWLFRLVMQPWRVKRQFALINYLLLLAKR